MSANFSDPAVYQRLPHDTRGHVVIVTSYATAAVATLVVSLRFYTRFFVTRQHGVDDYLAFITLACYWLCVGTQVVGVQYGLGTHIWDIVVQRGPDSLNHYFACLYSIAVCYNATMAMARVTILVQYGRVIAVQNLRVAWMIVTFVVGGWSVSQIFWCAFMCMPIAKFWNPSIQGSCVDFKLSWYVNAGSSLLTDFVVLVFPLPVMYQLNLPSRQKLLVLGLFGLGFFTVIISSIRLTYMSNVDDLAYDGVYLACWSMAESSSAIVCAGLITLRPLVQKFTPQLLASTMNAPCGWGENQNQPGIYPTDIEGGKSPHNRPSQPEKRVLPAHARHDSKLEEYSEQNSHDAYNKGEFDSRQQLTLPKHEPADAGLDLELGPYPYSHDTYSHSVTGEMSFEDDAHFSKQYWGSVNSEEGIVRPANSRTSLDESRRGSVDHVSLTSGTEERRA